MKKLYFLSALILAIISCQGQIYSYSPEYPEITDSLEIIFDASAGNAELSGVASVWAHTGIISSYSTNDGDWMHKPARWGKNDSTILMDDLGNNLHRFKVHIKNFYGIAPAEKAREVCFVFRNDDGSIAVKEPSGDNIYIHIWEEGQIARFTKPSSFPLSPVLGQSVPVQIRSKESGLISLYNGTTLLTQAPWDTIMNYTFVPTSSGVGKLWFQINTATGTYEDSIRYIVREDPVIEALPDGIKDGVTITGDSSVLFSLYAPYKNFTYLIGDFNDWKAEPAYQMKKTPDGERFWIELQGLDPEYEYGFQYFIDFDINIGDPYSPKVLDQWSDGIIYPTIYPDLKPYPAGKTTEMVSVFKINKPEYTWQVENFQKPDSRDLVIYELLLRDFNKWHDFQFLVDSIDYFKRLGVNAIQLMPIIEFDGYQSWGYMPAYHFGLDKYYGPDYALKEFVDECHKNGIAVILDIVFNHASGQSPIVRLYQDKETGHPTSQNPWFNEYIPHPYGFHSDFDHASYLTQDFMDRCVEYWIDEFHVDGYRFDLSKGFTNITSAGYDVDGNQVWSDLGTWGSYDNSRVYWLKRMADNIWNKYPGTFLILEHFASNDEEKELSNYGFMLWGNANHAYRSAINGWINENYTGFDGVNYQTRGWTFHNLVGYMESHDEERMMYEALTWGNDTMESHTGYAITSKPIALDRMAMCASFFFTIPGPKMTWQFAEMGYDYSINWPALEEPGATRVDPKPPRWDYMKDTSRQKLWKKYAALINLKRNYPIFRTSNFELNTGNADKRIRLWDDGYTGSDMQVVVLGNFAVKENTVWPMFSHAGKWYDYFSGDSLEISDGQIGAGFTMQYNAGEYHIYTDQKLPVPDIAPDTAGSNIGFPEIITKAESSAYPNPFTAYTRVEFFMQSAGEASFSVFDISGKEVYSENLGNVPVGKNSLIWKGNTSEGINASKGIYIYVLKLDAKTIQGKLIRN